MVKPDLNKLKNEIDGRKKQRNMSSSILGEQLSEQVGGNVSPRDTFLYGLIESWNTGRETTSSRLIKTVDNKAAIKAGETSRLSIAEVAPVQHQVSTQRLNEVDMSPERDEQLFQDLESKRKLTIAESIEQYTKTPPIGTPMSNKIGQPMQSNEAYLVENVKKIVNNYLVENFGPVLEEAIKSTIIEMYAVERIKEVLQENKEMIKTVVYETIRELQAKSKPKAH